MKGFSLIELMVVVGLAGVIGALAYPRYLGYVADTYRARAVADMQICALALDRYYANVFTYVNGAGECTLWSPADSHPANKEYTLTLQNLSRNDYTIRATPVSGVCPCIELDASGDRAEIP